MSEDCKEVKGWRGRCLGKSVQAEGTAHSKSLRWGQRGGHLFSWGHSEEKAASRNEVGEVRGLAGTSCGVCSRLLLLRVKWEAGNGLEQGRNGIQVSFQPKRLSLHACSQRLPAAKPVWPPLSPAGSACPAPLASLVPSSLGPSWELPPCILEGVQKRRETGTRSHSSLGDLPLGPAERPPAVRALRGTCVGTVRVRGGGTCLSEDGRIGSRLSTDAEEPLLSLRLLVCKVGRLHLCHHYVTVGGCHQHHMLTVLSGRASG